MTAAAVRSDVNDPIHALGVEVMHIPIFANENSPLVAECEGFRVVNDNSLTVHQLHNKRPEWRLLANSPSVF
jgi:hypothetical protein